ncbi:MAG: hypothetical protein A4E25_00341 [Methanobacterium sp. PtaB.Bin024]|nr:MAG: hypothetical protein A4E25_00341 [Methanobacterium sp. PtaB.Bin024]
MIRDKQITYEHPSILKKRKHVPLTFTRASVAYDKYGNSVPVNTPRFGIAGGPNDGVLIEEKHTNLLTADVSQALTTESPYTTGTLNGTYTFSCMTGSYELSGGATGTVTPTSPQTKTITSATVTLTGTATFNQCTNTRYPLSWTLGGTTMEAESLTAPSSVLDIVGDGTGQGTIECEAYIPSTHKPIGAIGYNWNILSHQAGISSSYNNIRFYHSGSARKVRLLTSDASGNISYADGFADDNIETGWNDFAGRYSPSSIIITKNGDTSGQSVQTTVKMPTEKGTLYIGSYGLIHQFNGIIRNVTISRRKRSDGEITNRYYRDGFGVDKEVTLIAPLKNNLNAYRVATV